MKTRAGDAVKFYGFPSSRRFTLIFYWATPVLESAV